MTTLVSNIALSIELIGDWVTSTGFMLRVLNLGRGLFCKTSDKSQSKPKETLAVTGC
jgi:hypothetical protein